MTARLVCATCALLTLGPALALAQPGASEAEMTQQDVEAWLAADPEEVDAGAVEDELSAPLPSPRRHGWVIEGSVGALGHLGHMRNISPVAPWLRLQVGYEPLDWWMVFAEGDVSLTSTEFASRPPQERGYALFGFGLGTRLSWQPFDFVGVYLQGDAGLSSVNHDVLSTYGYADADRLRPYFGGMLGLEWFQISPHYGIALSGGVRDYLQTFERVNGAKPPLVWLGGVALRYAL